MRNITNLTSDPDRRLIKGTKHKAVISGNHLEFYQYDKPVFYNLPPIVKEADPNKEKNSNRRIDSIVRARNNVRRIIESNSNLHKEKLKLLTITFKENIQDLNYANIEFTKFIKRLNYLIRENKTARLKYITVVEFQKRGAMHFHTLFFNLPYYPIQKIQDIWEHGNIDIKSIRKIKNIASYVAKYLQKEIFNNKLCGKKAYFCSRGLKRPIFIRKEYKALTIFDACFPLDIKYENIYQSKYHGKVLYTTYDLSQDPAIKERIKTLIKERCDM
jgi:hypothetical protein